MNKKTKKKHMIYIGIIILILFGMYYYFNTLNHDPNYIREGKVALVFSVPGTDVSYCEQSARVFVSSSFSPDCTFTSSKYSQGEIECVCLI